MAHIHIYPETKTVYVYLQPDRIGEKGAVAETKRIDMNTMLDYDANREAFGIEILDCEIFLKEGKHD